MAKKIKDSKWLYIVLSILMSITLWVYVVNVEGRPVTKPIDHVPVTYTGTDILASRELMITQGMEQELVLQIQSKWNTLGKLNQANITASVDVAGITAPGSYTKLVTVSYPSSVSRSSVVLLNNDEDLTVRFTVSKMESKEVPIKGEFTGSVASGYQAGEFVITPGTINISGQQELVNQVAYARVTLAQTEMSETFTGDLAFTYVGADGQEVPGTQMVSNVERIHVVFPIVMVAEVPLRVEFIPGGGATLEDITYSISPETIDVTGVEADITSLKEITLGQIDLSKVVSTQTFQFPIVLAGELTNESGIAEATVTVTVNGLATREFEVDDIELINVPEGYKAESVTQTRMVLVRGAQEPLDKVFQSQLRIVADLSNAPTAVGRYTVPAKIYLNGSSDVGVVGDCNIVVLISR